MYDHLKRIRDGDDVQREDAHLLVTREQHTQRGWEREASSSEDDY